MTMRLVIVVLSYIFILLLHINCILVIRRPDDVHSGDRNVLLKNNNVIEYIYKCVSVGLSYVVGSKSSQPDIYRVFTNEWCSFKS